MNQTTNQTTKQTLKLTRDEALVAIKTAPRKGSRFFVFVPVQLPIEGEEGKVFSSGASIHVSREDAVRFIEQAISEKLTARGGRIEITVEHSTSVLGSRHYYHIG